MRERMGPNDRRGICPWCGSAISTVVRDGVVYARCSHRGCGARGPTMQDERRACDLFANPPPTARQRAHHAEIVDAMRDALARLADAERERAETQASAVAGNERARAEMDAIRSERDEARAEVAELRAEVERLRKAMPSDIDPENTVLLDFYTGGGAYAASIGDKDSSDRITSQKASPGTTIRSFKVRAGDILDALRTYARRDAPDTEAT